MNIGLYKVRGEGRYSGKCKSMHEDGCPPYVSRLENAETPRNVVWDKGVEYCVIAL